VLPHGVVVETGENADQGEQEGAERAYREQDTAGDQQQDRRQEQRDYGDDGSHRPSPTLPAK